MNQESILLNALKELVYWSGGESDISGSPTHKAIINAKEAIASQSSTSYNQWPSDEEIESELVEIRNVLNFPLDYYLGFQAAIKWLKEKLSESTNKEGEERPWDKKESEAFIEMMKVSEIKDHPSCRYIWNFAINWMKLQNKSLPSSKPEVSAIEVIKRAYAESKRLTHGDHPNVKEGYHIANEMQDILGIYLEGEYKLWKQEYDNPSSSQPSIEWGIKWVKASERLPENMWQGKFRDINDNSLYEYRGFYEHSKGRFSTGSLIIGARNVEWLDKSQPPKGKEQTL